MHDGIVRETGVLWTVPACVLARGERGIVKDPCDTVDVIRSGELWYNIWHEEAAREHAHGDRPPFACHTLAEMVNTLNSWVWEPVGDPIKMPPEKRKVDSFELHVLE